MIFPQVVTERHYQVVERQLQAVERRSGPFRLNLTTALHPSSLCGGSFIQKF